MTRKAKQGIWQYARLLPFIAQKYRLSLEEGSTELVERAGIFFKCEFNNPTGSVKDRAICFQLAKIKEKGERFAVVSSSGNAAISAAHYSNLHHIGLTVYVSPKINPYKLAKIDKTAKIIRTKKPVSAAVKVSHNKKIPNLRQSTDPFGTIGYQTISYELARCLPKIDAVFVPVSSGAILKGLYEGFAKQSLFPALHAVQTSHINSISSQFDDDFNMETSTLADAIVAKYSPLEDEVIKIIKRTNGWGWVITNRQMQDCSDRLKRMELTASYEGAAALAAIYKAIDSGFRYLNPVCLLTGSMYG